MATTIVDIPEGTAPMRPVRMSETLFQMLGAEYVNWGEPDADGFYTPNIHTEIPSRVELLKRLQDCEAQP